VRKGPETPKWRLPSSIAVLDKNVESIFRTDAGTESDFSEEQPSKTSRPIRTNCETDSKVTIEREMQPPKRPSPRTLTEDGMHIARNSVHAENAAVKRGSLQFRSKCNEERESQPWKQQSPRNSTDDGMQIDRNDTKSKNNCAPSRINFEDGSRQ
jgi:hypothetical protein